ncbi:DUF3422 family protein [Rhodospirillum centenum]|uniref:DUF3422 domain-containing protein n=1 Tax=Rhodospirillum centenum (strain ATCC 51521 / SW) TaxID=414684 RepID=B6IRY0_RHOCS|nr:DUF3422 domain-containing protein [Rhodospirillum centenum]ACI98216.1 conserved hypothetical protein [Rhodospirillum centenum SW]
MDVQVQPVAQHHPQRRRLNDEVHARPSLYVRTPSRVTHLAILTGEPASLEREMVAELCRRHGAPPPGPGDRHMLARIGTRQLKWERHTEFTSITVAADGLAGDDDWSALDPELEAWADRLPGERLVAVHVRVEPGAGQAHWQERISILFPSGEAVGSSVYAGDALAWTDFRIRPDGFSRMLLRDVRLLTPDRTGRLVQRLVELETYRMMALLSLPLAQEVGGQLSAMEHRLSEIVSSTAKALTPDAEHGLLDELTLLAAEAEALASRTRYRFSATTAYAELISRRLEELREERIGGLQRIGSFLSRRFFPAVRTCEAVGRRQAELGKGLARASGMLRTRVDVRLAEQNAGVLRSMDRRTKAQLRIQQTVEGLSVFAISYYAVGLLKYVVDGLPALGIPVSKELFAAIAAPAVVAAVWLAVRRLKEALMAKG